MPEPKLHLYEVGASEKKEGKSWWSNISYNVLTDSITRALELFYEEHPDADVHRVEKRDRVNDVKYDPRLNRGHGCTKCRREAFLRWKAKKGGDS